MGIRSWLYWVDRALAGDRRPLAVLSIWLALVAIGLTYYLLR